MPFQDKMINLSSPYLFHFTTKLEYLVSILKKGFEYRPLKEDLPLTGYTGSVWSIPGIVKHEFTWDAVCFCDIPEYSIKDHSNQYGEYGICLRKNWGIEKGITPIRYIHHSTPDFNNDVFYTIKDTLADMRRYRGSFSSMIAHMLNQSKNIPLPTDEEWAGVPEKIKSYFSQIDEELYPILNHSVRYLGLARSYDGDWKDRVTGNSGKRIFYDEKEWRSLKMNQDQGNIEFQNEDVVAVILPRVEERETIQKELEPKISKEKFMTLEEHIEKSCIKEN